MNINRTISTLKDFLSKRRKSNRMILTDETRAVVPHRVNLHFWRINKGQHYVDNLGDYLSFVVVEYMKKHYGLTDEKKLPKTRHLYAIGSILQAGYHDATVWGSGFLEYPLGGKLAYVVHGKMTRKLDIRSVRGPLTREALIKLGHNCPEVYGDPAILMPMVYTPKIQEKKQPYVVVRHYLDTKQYEADLPILTSDYQSFIDRLCSSERVISSSLHGIILAEAYGIPAVLYLPEWTEELTLYKYKDYYYGTGRSEFPVARTVEEALTMEPCPVPDLTERRNKLLDVFPRDLWE